MRAISAVLLLGTLPLAACGNGPDYADSDRGVAGEATASTADDRFGITTRDGNVRLGLTDEVVYFRLSDELLQKIDREIESELPEESGLGRTIGEAVRSGISSALRHQMQYDIDDIRDIRYDDERLIVEFEDPDRELPDLEVDDEPLLESFPASDARRFAREFRRAKRDR